MVKLAVSGKGGVGKTTLTAVLAHLFARDGYNVTAIDADSAMNLPTALGVSGVKPLSELKEVIDERVRGPMGTYRVNPKVDDIFEMYSVRNEDGVRVAVLGTIEKGGDGCFCPENAFLRAILRHAIFREKDVLLLDMEAGIEHLGRGTAKGVDLLIAVVEPGMRSFETLARIEKLASDIGIDSIAVVVNKYIESERARELVESIEKPLLGVIPYSQEFVRADLENIPPYKVVDLKPFEEIKRNIVKLVGE
ncbi:Carbon monoxide dehydrogenase accessory protein CooC [Geoglobus ahangari]|uniref:Carbon monoxide dehydrogenase accessory protein CooC n=1 Tax=Geoglobus ahangari TaxID=113653 RepID=A0A0F7IGG7_9EURY|nr:P-loop NTPase [Geoglobus ahangari]AKG92340.1 Carbon monoxide dehydrogenase accessory protein CooC [Geoglobus ahangari]NOY11284.1 P-loop NTPase [Archaeoglobi archaeon]